jgi:pyruvate,water dikinase
LEGVSKKIIPLHLTDPNAKSFKPKFCTTLHDITRFSHELSINQMFEFSDNLASGGGKAKRLISDIPLNIYVINLDGGLESTSNSKTIKPEQIKSVPMKALWKGMSHKGVRWAGHIPINFKGFFSVFANTVFDPAKGERALGDKSYAILSKNYVNFNSRLGYHFSTLDAYCSDAKNDNYISYRFKGGAASIDKRERRARFIAEVLKKLGFWIEQKGDLVNATLRKYNREAIEEKMDLLGRLMGCIRQLDVTMHSDKQIVSYVEEFMKGNYSLGLDT